MPKENGETKSYYQSQFATFHGFKPGSRRKRYADWAIGYLYEKPAYAGVTDGTYRRALKQEMISKIRSAYEFGFFEWLILQWIIVKIIELAIEYWLGL